MPEDRPRKGDSLLFTDSQSQSQSRETWGLVLEPNGPGGYVVVKRPTGRNRQVHISRIVRWSRGRAEYDRLSGVTVSPYDRGRR